MRVGAGVLGGCVFVVSAIITVGTALAAPIGVFVARTIARRRGRAVTRWTTWIGATVASCVAVAALVTTFVVRAPTGTLQTLRDVQRADTAARNAPPPAWVTRLFPQAAQRPNAVTEHLVRSTAFTGYILVETAGLMLLMFAVLAGSAGWAGTLLLAYAFRHGPSG